MPNMQYRVNRRVRFVARRISFTPFPVLKPKLDYAFEIYFSLRHTHLAQGASRRRGATVWSIYSQKKPRSFDARRAAFICVCALCELKHLIFGYSFWRLTI